MMIDPIGSFILHADLDETTRVLDIFRLFKKITKIC